MKVILKSKITGKINGEKSKSDYRIVIEKQENGEWLFSPEQAFNGVYNEYSGLPGWYLSTLMDDISDEVYIDYGQGWSISGIKEAIAEARDIIRGTDESLFDDVTTDDDGHNWSQICNDCVQKLSIPDRILCTSPGSGICGVEGCSKEADYYIDF